VVIQKANAGRQRQRPKVPPAAEIERLRETLRRRDAQSDADRLTEVLDGIRQQAERRLAEWRRSSASKVFLQVDLDTYGPPGLTYDPQEAAQRLGTAIAVRREAETAAVAATGARATHHPGRMFAVGCHVGQNDSLEALPRRVRSLILQRLKERNSERARRGGQAPKRLPGVWGRVCELIRKNPRITVAAVWKLFPDVNQARSESEILIYRDGNKLVELDDRTGRERPITYDTFRGYLRDARKHAR